MGDPMDMACKTVPPEVVTKLDCTLNLCFHRCGRYVLPAGAFSTAVDSDTVNAKPAGATAGPSDPTATNFDMKQMPHVYVPSETGGSVVVDLSNVTYAAISNWTERPNPFAATEFPGTLANASQTEFTGFCPWIRVSNASDHVAYVVVGCSPQIENPTTTFHGVSKVIGVRVRESLTLHYNPIKNQWLVVARDTTMS